MAALPKRLLNELALGNEKFLGQSATVLSGHHPLYAFQERIVRSANALEMLAKVDDFDTYPVVGMLVIGGLINILKSSPNC